MDSPRAVRPRWATSLAISAFVLGSLPLLVATPVLAQEAAPVSDAFEIVSGPDDLTAWTITEGPGQWSVELQGPTDARVSIALLTPAMVVIDRSWGWGQAELFDLELEPGAYLIQVEGSSPETLPYRVRTALQDQTFDPEPNDTSDQAVKLEDGAVVQGRLARTDSDVDRYRISVPPGSTDLTDIRLEWSADVGRQLCLLDADGRDLTCRSGNAGTALLDVRLKPEYLLEVRGAPDPDADYVLRVGPRVEGRPDYEAEPNDVPALASPLDLGLGISGRSAPTDTDFLRATVEGDPQLWRIEVTGPDLDLFYWVNADGAELESADLVDDGRRAVLTDLFLIPGDHRFRVNTRSGSYRLEATPLGPPDPDAEREPNSDVVRAERYAIGQRRVGRLPVATDVDYYSFTIAAPEHLTFRLEQPPDADVEVSLEGGGEQILRQRASQPGAPIDLDLWLEPSDYFLRLRPVQPSDGTYQLTSERADPFDLLTDQEPNDSRGSARPVPGTFKWQGTARHERDYDWYRLPALPAPTAVVATIDADRAILRLYAGNDQVDLEQDEDGRLFAAEVAAGVPVYVEVEASSPYEVMVKAEGWASRPEPLVPSVEIVLDLETDMVAAYWPESQRVDGTLTLRNAGDDDLELSLAAVSSHYAWEVVPATDRLGLPAGGTERVPVSVRIRPDAWADEPVRVSVAAQTTDGGRTSASADIVASRDAAPVDPGPGFEVPEALLGGLNVASLSLGAEPLGLTDPVKERTLFDGMTPVGGFGFKTSPQQFPVEIAVDLAGEVPLPIRGTIINPLARESRLREVPRDFELLLSTDGETWTSALTGRITPLPIDQAFVLDEPMLASYAMLRVTSVHADGSSVTLGEWKVVAEPGATPDPMPQDIADPEQGGRMARYAPFVNDFEPAYRMLDADPRRESAGVRDPHAGFDVVIGFQDGRAAQVTSVRWQDPDGSDEATRLDEVEVQVSTDSPLGPWQKAGTWSLTRDDSGAVPPFELGEPTWARYVRLSTRLAEGVRSVELPAVIEVIERPTDDEYRSILGEWGYASRVGPYELLVPPSSSTAVVGPDAGDTREDATPLALGATVSDRVETAEDTDWYRIDIPPVDNMLEVELGGVPRVGARATLLGPSGEAVAMVSADRPGGTVRYTATVEPGSSYDLLVEQPPLSVVFLFDTSDSMGLFVDLVMGGMRSFAADVEPGKDAVMIMPLGQEPLLDDWEDRPHVLQDAVNGFAFSDGVSSAAEEGLIAATELLGERDGTRAILLVSDAETTSMQLTPDLWKALAEVRPIIDSVHLANKLSPRETRDVMQAWAYSSAGSYENPTTFGEMNRLFDRMSARLRRPAAYALTATTANVNLDPGTLSVRAPEGAASAGIAPGVGVGIILDTSGSMRKKLAGKRRIDIARASLRQLVSETLAEGVPVAIRTFGGAGNGKAARCETRLSLPLAPLDRPAALEVVDGLKARRSTRTPIAAALTAVAGDLAAVSGPRTVVLISDGAETCKGDPAGAVEFLRASGLEVNLNVVGFALEEAALKEQMASWAEAGGGRYFDASSAAELAASIATAVSAPFRVYGSDDALVASGIVGGGPVELAVGTYRVEVLVAPPVEFDDVVVKGGESATLVIDSRS